MAAGHACHRPSGAPTPDPSAKTPAFGDDFAAFPSARGGQFATGRWSMDSAGTTGTFTSLTADTGGPCESVQIGFDAVAPTVEIMRIPYLNYTVIRFDTDQVSLAPGPTALSPSRGLVTGVVAFQDNNGPAVLVQHPGGVKVAARSVISSNSVTIEFRAGLQLRPFLAHAPGTRWHIHRRSWMGQPVGRPRS